MVNYIYIDRSGHKRARPVRNRREYFVLRNTPANVRNFRAARGGDARAKAALKQFNYNDLLPNGVLKGCCHAASTFALDIDCGQEDDCRRTAQRLLEMKAAAGLLELSVSARWGLHVVCRRLPGRTILENQVRISMLAQTEMDTSAHDAQRVMFTGPATPDVLLFLDDAIFEEPLTEEESAREHELLAERERTGAEQLPPGAKNANKHYRPWEAQADDSRAEPPSQPPRGAAHISSRIPSETQVPPRGDSEGAASAEAPLSFRGIPYAKIIETYWQRTGGEPQEGERNVKLHRLAVNLRAICDNKAEVLLRVMPRFGLADNEVSAIVESACREQPRCTSKLMLDILQQLGADVSTEGGESLAQTLSAQTTRLNEQLEAWGSSIEALMGEFPQLADVCKGLRRGQYPAAMFVAGGLMMTLMTRCTYRFYHRPEELRRLNNSTFVIGDPASGKSFATRLYKLLAAPIVAADQVGKDAINAYRELVKTKGANKEKPKKPKVVVRIHPARTSNAQFIQDMVNAVEDVDGKPMQLHMLTFDTELDNTMAVQRGGSWIDKQSLELKAFHNEEDGQAYSNVDSIMQDFIVTWNFIYTGTPMALRKKVNSANFGSGLATRLTCIPLPSTNFEMMERQTTIDVESDERLADWARRLDRMKGMLPLEALVDKLWEWTARRMADARDNDSRADEMLLKRCAYHGLNFAAPFIVMRHWGEIHPDGTYFCGSFATDDTDWRLTELIANIQFACQRHFFGALAEDYFEGKTKDACIGAQNKRKTFEAFERLPEKFTNDDVRRCFNLANEPAARNKIKRMIDDHLIEKVSDSRQAGVKTTTYRKTGCMML